MNELAESPWPADTWKLRVGEIEIDLRYRSVHRSGASNELNPRCFDLLLLFLREPRVLHTREAIFLRVWPGVIVEDASLTTSIWMLRRALGGVARQWIRTVSKQGYVFDPPASAPIRACVPEPEQEPDAAAPTVGEARSALGLPAGRIAVIDEPPIAMPRVAVPAAMLAPAARSHRWPAAIVASALLATLAGAVAMKKDAAPAAPLRVALVIAPAASGGTETAWPAQLLHGWLEWQLRSVPGIVLVDPLDTCETDCRELSVLLSAGMTAQGTDEWQVSARLRGPAAPADVREVTNPERLPATIGEVSRAVLATLTSVDGSRYPALELDPASSAALARGFSDERQRRWQAAAHAYSEVVERAPSFAFARQQLAASLTELGQPAAARAELDRTDAWLETLPVSLQRPLRARAARIRNEHALATTPYAELGQGDAGNGMAYRIAEAHSLLRIGRNRDALARLSGKPPITPALAVPWLLTRAEAEADNQDLAHAAASATRALKLASGLGWDHERAQAALLLADMQTDDDTRAALHAQAEQAFERAGDRLGSLRARVRSELSLAADTPGMPQHVNELLAEARVAGNTSLEIDTLRRSARHHYRASKVAFALEQLTHADAVARAAGTPYERLRTSLDLLGQETLRMDFDTLDQRLAALRSEPLQGAMVYTLGMNQARLQYLRGEYVTAYATLQRTDDALRDAATGSLPHLAAKIGCTRIGLDLVQGRAAAARNDIRDCRFFGQPPLDHFADVADTELALHAGDLVEARRLLAPMQDMLAKQASLPDRWLLAAEIAPLLARAGELDAARQLVEEALPPLIESGYRLIELDARVTLAEIALAQGRTADAERAIRASAAIAPEGLWYEQRRIRTVQALLARAQGQFALARTTLETLHAQTRERGDVLGELLAHSLMEAGDAACSDEGRARLLAQSGMRGATDLWMSPLPRRGASSLAVTAH